MIGRQYLDRVGGRFECPLLATLSEGYEVLVPSPQVWRKGCHVDHLECLMCMPYRFRGTMDQRFMLEESEGQETGWLVVLLAAQKKRYSYIVSALDSTECRFVLQGPNVNHTGE